MTPRIDGNPDVLADARELTKLPPAAYDAVYCSHNLEHYHRHHAAKVVQGFAHVLKPDGFVQILVPDILAVMRKVVKDNLDVDDVLYVSRGGPLLVRDLIYGYHVPIERSDNDFYAHKTCFSLKCLPTFMAQNGFPVNAVASFAEFEIGGYFFRQIPSEALFKMLKLFNRSDHAKTPPV
jgi:SAM-dependent methyltransferase